MKTTKLTVGIIMIVLSVWIFIQSSFAGLGNALSNNHQSSGTAGIFVGLLYLAAGIIYIAARKNDGLGGDITNLILMIIAGLMGFAAGDYSDLKIWAGLAVIIGLMFFIWHLVVRSQNAKAAANKPSAPEPNEAQQTPSSSTQH